MGQRTYLLARPLGYRTYRNSLAFSSTQQALASPYFRTSCAVAASSWAGPAGEGSASVSSHEVRFCRAHLEQDRFRLNPVASNNVGLKPDSCPILSLDGRSHQARVGDRGTLPWNMAARGRICRSSQGNDINADSYPSRLAGDPLGEIFVDRCRDGGGDLPLPIG